VGRKGWRPRRQESKAFILLASVRAATVTKALGELAEASRRERATPAKGMGKWRPALHIDRLSQRTRFRSVRPWNLFQERIPRLRRVVMSTYHTHQPVTPEPESRWTGYAAVKYTAIVVIVLAILAFLAWYVIPAFGGH
jgi:hypothetical protein